MSSSFTSAEKHILAIVQGNLPDSLTPYKDIAHEAGVSEQEVLALLQRLKENGAIRRFGASIRHQQAGWAHNAMVAWKATEAEADKYGSLAALSPNISHAYFRPSSIEDWPYTFYTMVHGRSEDECRDVVEKLAAGWPLKEFIILRSVRELKKTSMIYFD